MDGRVVSSGLLEEGGERWMGRSQCQIPEFLDWELQDQTKRLKKQ